MMIVMVVMFVVIKINLTTLVKTLAPVFGLEPHVEAVRVHLHPVLDPVLPVKVRVLMEVKGVVLILLEQEQEPVGGVGRQDQQENKHLVLSGTDAKINLLRKGTRAHCLAVSLISTLFLTSQA